MYIMQSVNLTPRQKRELEKIIGDSTGVEAAIKLHEWFDKQQLLFTRTTRNKKKD